jgi:hypothetical protein
MHNNYALHSLFAPAKIPAVIAKKQEVISDGRKAPEKPGTTLNKIIALLELTEREMTINEIGAALGVNSQAISSMISRRLFKGHDLPISSRYIKASSGKRRLLKYESRKAD